MPHKILLVDDNASFREMLAEILSDIGHRVTQAEDGEDATELIASEFRPDCVVTDLHMPKMNGLELARMIRAKYSVPIIVCTSDSNAESLCQEISNIKVIDKTFEGIKKIISHLS